MHDNERLKNFKDSQGFMNFSILVHLMSKKSMISKEWPSLFQKENIV